MEKYQQIVNQGFKIFQKNTGKIMDLNCFRVSTPSKNNNYHNIVKKNDEETLKSLISKLQNCGIDKRDAKGRTPLAIAIEKRNSKSMKLLLDAGATHDNRHYNKQCGPLHLAARNGYYDGVKILIDSYAFVNALDESGNSPLLYLVWKRNKKENHDERERIAKILLDAGAKKNAKNRAGKSPLHLAIENGHHKVALTLLNEGANVKIVDEDLQTPLHLSVKAGHVHLTKRLIQHGANVSASDRKGLSPFNYAIRSRNGEMIKLFCPLKAKCSFSAEYEFSLEIKFR